MPLQEPGEFNLIFAFAPKKRFFVVVVAGTEIFRLKIATCIQINLFEMENFHSPPRVRDYVMAQIFSSPRQIELADNWRKLSKRQPWHRNFGCGAREAWCGSCGARSTSIVEHSASAETLSVRESSPNWISINSHLTPSCVRAQLKSNFRFSSR